MKKILNFLTLACFISASTFSLQAQMAYMPAPVDNELDYVDLTADEEVSYNTEEVKDYLPIESTTLFGGIEEDEDISNYLPLASPLFGQEESEEYLPLESDNGYFLETNDTYTESSYAVYADNKFEEIIVSFDAAKEENIQVNLFNSVGVKIRQETYNTDSGFNNFSLDIENLPRGLYTLKLTGNTQNVIKKFVIK